MVDDADLTPEDRGRKVLILVRTRLIQWQLKTETKTEKNYLETASGQDTVSNLNITEGDK